MAAGDGSEMTADKCPIELCVTEDRCGTKTECNSIPEVRARGRNDVKMSIGVLIGIVGGFCGLRLFVVFCCCKKDKKVEAEDEDDDFKAI